MRRAVCLVSALVLAGCGSRVAATSPSVTPLPTIERSSPLPTPSAPRVATGNQEAVPGPAGMTLQQEVGAVMMVGFKGPLTPALLEDWRQHQYGGLIVVPNNQNAADSGATRQLIQSLRGVMLHPLLAGTNREGLTDQSVLTTRSRELKAVGFDINFAPVAEAQDVPAAIGAIHATGMYAAATAFPGRGKVPFQAAIATHVEFVTVENLTAPSIDASVPASMSPAVMRLLRTDLAYAGVVISDDLQSEVLGSRYPPPRAAVSFLQNGGDMVIIAGDIAVADATYAAIYAAVVNGSYPRAQLDLSVQKLLSLGLRFMP